MDAPLAKARLLPPRLHRGWVERRRLLDRLDRADALPLTLVVAPAGFGKTGLVAQWATTDDRAVAWLTLDARDDDLVAFTTMLAGAVNAAVPQAVVSPQRYLDVAGASPDPAVLATHLLNDLADLPADLAIVVDDAHLLTRPGPLAVLEALATAGIPGIRPIVLARADPPWNLAGLRASGRIAELRAADLRLTVEEVADYARHAGWEDIAPQDAETIHAVSQGWLTAVRLLCAAPERWREHGGDAPAGHLGRSAEAMGWLLGEALAAMPARERDLLLRLAVPERVTRSLAEALGAGVCPPAERRAIYDRLVADGLFLSRPDGEGWSALHAQVREAMLDRLRTAVGADQVRWLHATASDWFLDRSMHDEAIRHAQAAGGPERAAGIVRLALRPALLDERRNDLGRWLAALPPELVHGDPELLVGVAGLAWAREDIPATLQAVAEARALLHDLPEERRRVLGLELDVFEAATGFFRGRLPEAERLAAGAIAGLPADSPHALITAWTIVLLAQSSVDPAGAAERIVAAVAGASALPADVGVHLWSLLSIVTFQQGDARRTVRLCERVRSMAPASRSRFAGSWADALAAIAAYQLDDLDATIAHATAILGRTAPAHRTAIRESLIVLALAYEAKGQRDDADLTVDRLEEIVLATGALNEMPLVAALRAWLALRRGDLAAARAWHGATEAGKVAHATNSLVDQSVIHGAIGLALGIEPARVLADLERFLASPHAASTLTWRIELEALAAAARLQLGDEAGAREAIARALGLAGPFGLVRPLLDRDPLIEPVLALVADDPALAGQVAALRAALAAERRRRSRPASPGQDGARPLSERELEVLELLARRLTNKEIGTELRISPLTVKRHTINIYAKLGVGSRRQAIQQARELGLVDASPADAPAPAAPA